MTLGRRRAWYAPRMESGSTVEELAAAFALGAPSAAALGCYVDLITSWREANVTGIRRREDVVRLLLADALSLLDVPDLQSRVGLPWVDLGAGAGLPGIPLCAALPAAQVTLLEAVGRKCRFLEAAVAAAGLAERARVVCARSERYAAAGQPGREGFAAVLARAVAPLPVLVELAAPLLRPGGVLLASKTGRGVTDESPSAERAAALCGLSVGPVVPLPRSPLDDAVCAIFVKTGETPASLPRREGLAAKRPLGAGPKTPAADPPPATIEGTAKGAR